MPAGLHRVFHTCHRLKSRIAALDDSCGRPFECSKRARGGCVTGLSVMRVSAVFSVRLVPLGQDIVCRTGTTAY